jgi:Mce-associated membrane protein
MTVKHDSSPEDTQTALDGIETPTTDEDGAPHAHGGSARVSALVALHRWARWCLASWHSIVATAFVVAAVAVAVALFVTMYRPDRQIDDAAAHRAIQAASDGAEDLMSYSYASLDRDFAKAKSHLTGDFLTYYGKFTEALVAPAAQQGQLTATTKVTRAAVSELHPDSAVVLVFVDQTTASKQKPQPIKADSSILVTLRKVHGSWLIAKFDPVA